MSTTITEEAPITVVVYRSTLDGALVVEIDSETESGRIRVNLNEGHLYDADPEDGKSDRDWLNEIGSALNYGDGSKEDVLDAWDNAIEIFTSWEAQK